MKNLITMNNKMLSVTEKQHRRNEKTTVLVMAICIACLPELALAGAAAEGTIGTVIDSLTTLMNGAIARSVAVLFCIGMGFAAWAGKLSWKMAGNFIAGITLIFGAASFVSLIETGA